MIEVRQTGRTDFAINRAGGAAGHVSVYCGPCVLGTLGVRLAGPSCVASDNI